MCAVGWGNLPPDDPDFKDLLIEPTSAPKVAMRSRDGVTLGPRNDVTSDVIGGPAPKLPVWELVLGLASAQDVDLPCPWRIRSSST